MKPVEIHLYKTLNAKYPDWLELQPETIRELPIVRENENAELIMNKIMALQTAVKSQLDDEGFHFTDWRMFEKFVLVFNDVIPDFTEIEQVEPYEIHKALSIFKKIKDKYSFSDDVIKYIAASYMAENIVYCPFYPEVDKFLENDELKQRTKVMWSKLDKIKNPFKLIEKTEEDVVSVQAKRLLRIKMSGGLIP